MNKNHPRWEKQLNYKNIHMWLGRHYGKAQKCSNPKCKKLSKIYQWSRIPNKPLDKNIKNFKELCRDCHISLDKRGNINMEESPKPMLVRFYKNQRKFIKKVAKKNKTSEATVVRNAIELIINVKKLEAEKKLSAH